MKQDAVGYPVHPRKSSTLLFSAFVGLSRGREGYWGDLSLCLLEVRHFWKHPPPSVGTKEHSPEFAQES
ncbi:hypothetical protein TCAL_15112 [Tigriopus californicus]|uniref:Uncharacterized protein n=1 Tax=Tigriopus californicus TaxID=6832 RepID=A0A553NVN7_TIGCA|nr:hypothetical protein TCAL_15112 [Tigriopus californicus]